MQEHTKTKSRQRQKHKNAKQTNIMQQLHTNTIQQIHKSTKQQRLTVKLRPAQKYNAINCNCEGDKILGGARHNVTKGGSL